MARLEDLPAPLPLRIMEQLPDLKALDAARRSCHLFAAVLTRYSVYLFECVMQRTLLDDVTAMIRLYVLLLLLDKHAGCRTLDSGMDQLRAQAQLSLPRNTPELAISHTLRLFSALVCEGNAILLRKLDKLHFLPHEHLAHLVLRKKPAHKLP